jgi:DUF1680 family protein
MIRSTVSRRRLLQAAAPATIAAGALSGVALAAPVLGAKAGTVEPFPMEAVRLEPSDFLTALQANTAYLYSLEPDRFLHNFRQQAGLKPKGEAYGGWEGDSIAGHSLGHYMSALALLHAQTGETEPCRRLDYIASELALCQSKFPDGYVGGLTYKHEGGLAPGHQMFEDVRAGKIHSTGFDLNGAWSPLYTVHKLMAGLLDAHRYCGNRQALAVAVKLGGYIDGVFAPLTPAQVQDALGCEYGGLNESYAELYARTGDRRWLRAAKLFYDNKVLDPLTQGQDDLANLHANTQIPKIIGLARLYELTGEPRYGVARDTFWHAVVEHHSYVIGGNADREYFQTADATAAHITEQTCESCNTYNMLKLTRQLYTQQPRAAYFDYYERAHLNHILAQQNPKTGMFAYMSPLMSGTSRVYSKPFDTFWCCVGTGMESHAKHGDSIYWRQGRDNLLVNLFIPSTLAWAEDGSRFRLSTDYPRSGEIAFEVLKREHPGELTIALRKPGWARTATVVVNGAPTAVMADADGYLRVRRRWRTGDRLTLSLPLDLRMEPTADDPKVIALLHGPVVLAADLGPAGKTPYDGPAPALVGASVLAGLKPVEGEPGAWKTVGLGRPQDLVLRSFAAQHERRTAVYFPHFTEAAWAQEQAAFRIEDAKRREIQARSTDVMHLGEMQAEHDHDLESKISYPVIYRGRNGRDARSGGYFQFHMKVRPGPMTLRTTYWGEERNRAFRILVDGTSIAHQTLDGEHPGVFFDQDYPIPPALTAGKTSVLVRFDPDPDHTAGPAFGVLCLGEGGGENRTA